MTSGLFLRLSLTVAVIPAAIAVALSGEAAAQYTKLVQPALLLVSCLLSLWVALMYRTDLRRAFLFLSAFLLLYGLVNINPLVEQAQKALGDDFLTLVISWQVADYFMLFLACFFILRAIGITTMGKWGIPVMGITLLLAVGVVANGMASFLDLLQVNTKAAVLVFLIRICDVVVLLMLVPVLFLYVEGARAKYQESATFAFVAFGIIASLVFVYVYELVKGQSITQIAGAEYQKGSLLDGLYIFMYLMVAVGLYAHRKHQQWSLKKIDKLIA
ncbi:MAG: hypothetical protein Q7K03_08200 [Dehalococcoidia bacterium]|nr:hypothetical protein [Dehalococcoidia bacterium]